MADGKMAVERVDNEKVAVDQESGSGVPEDHTNKLQPIDTVHQDEALKVLARYDGEQTWTTEEEKRVRRKIDRKLIPILCITYGLQYYDKAMLSQAVSLQIFKRIQPEPPPNSYRPCSGCAPIWISVALDILSPLLFSTLDLLSALIPRFSWLRDGL